MVESVRYIIYYNMFSHARDFWTRSLNAAHIIFIFGVEY